MQGDKQKLDYVLATAGVSLIMFLMLARGFLAESFWLDETISAWIVSGTLQEAFGRALRYQGQSPLYYMLLWCWVQVWGASEVSLRMPSLVLLGGTLGVVFSWVRRAVGVLPAAIAIVFLLSVDSFLVALSARPYAAGLLSIVLSLYFFDRGLAEGSSKRVWAGAFCLSLGCYFHFLFAFAGLLVLIRAGREFRRVVIPLLLSGIACVPLVGQFLSLAERREALLFLAPPHFLDLVRVILPLPALLQLVMAGAVVLICTSFLTAKKSEAKSDAQTCAQAQSCDQKFWIFCWWIAPSLLLWLFARIGSGPFVERYVIYTYPALALLIAFAAHRLLPKYLALIFFCAFALFVAVRFVDREWRVEEWRGAFADLRLSGSCPSGASTVLVYSGLVELENSVWRKNTAMWPYLNAPATVYEHSLTTRPLALTSDFAREVKEAGPVCGVVLLKRTPPPHVGLAPHATLSSEKLIITSLESVGIRLALLSPQGASVVAYRVHGASAATVAQPQSDPLREPLKNPIH